MPNQLLGFLQNSTDFNPDDFLSLRHTLDCNERHNLYFIGYLNHELYYMQHDEAAHSPQEFKEYAPSFFYEGRETIYKCKKCGQLLKENKPTSSIKNPADVIVTPNINQNYTYNEEKLTISLRPTIDKQQQPKPSNIIIKDGDTLFKVFNDEISLEELSNELAEKENIFAISIGKKYDHFNEELIKNCYNLRLIVFRGTREDWFKISKAKNWYHVPEDSDIETYYSNSIKLREEGRDTLLVIPAYSYMVMFLDSNWQNFDNRIELPDYIIEPVDKQDREIVYAEHSKDMTLNKHYFYFNSIQDIQINNNELTMVCCKFNASFNIEDSAVIKLGQDDEVSLGEFELLTNTGDSLQTNAFIENTTRLFALDYSKKKIYIFPEYSHYL